ncbi:MAG: dienelactone hydrolase family protein [Verrucomicrobiales bacterium]|jgi:predicted peptidase|nr:dienelactone hydrolase family protein [Verrucomicrobiales bacterium]
MNTTTKLLVIGSVALAQTAATVNVSGQTWQDEYTVRVYESPSGERMGYRLLAPKPLTAGKKYPVVLFFHGAGERGDDNLKQLIHCAGQFATPANRAQYPAFVIVPQCPLNQQWVNMPWGADTGVRPAQPSDAMRLALAILDSVEQEYAADIDLNRVYVSGISMGGYGTWDCVTRYPARFAAAVPICGGGDETTITAEVAKVPVWAFHAADDGAVKVNRTRNMIAAMQAAGGTPKYTEYPAEQKVGHGSWGPAYRDPELFPWLFSQVRK